MKLLRLSFLFLLHGAKASSNQEGSIRGGVSSSSDSHRKLVEEVTSTFTSTCNWQNGSIVYVNSSTGSDRSDYGSTTSQPYKSIAYAVSQREPCQTIYVMGGIYQNNYYGQSYNHQNTIATMTGVSDLVITAYDKNDKPVLKFDGPGGFVGGSTSSPTTNVAISGFEIIGPNYDIPYEDAASNRLTDRSYYKGRGVAIWAGHHIHISDLVVHGCPGSGIRVNKGDYVTITNCHVYDNTWWSPRAESAIVLAVSQPSDEQTNTKMYLTNNVVHDNVNKIPYYNPNYAWDYSPIGGLDCASYLECEQGLVDGCPWQCRYGKASQDYIIDGSGVYVTRNSDTYTHGWMELSGNTCYKNGINGLVVHRTHRATVKQNVIYDNGVVPRLDRPEEVVEDWHLGANGKSRQPYSGLTLNEAEDVKLWSNVVAARYEDDYAFVQEVDSGVPATVVAGGNNKACRGVVDINPASFVMTVEDLSICIPETTSPTPSPSASPTPIPKYVEIFCGDKCHIIQWSYDMGPSYGPTEDAEQLCADQCDARDCRAYSTQYDYQKNDGSRWCFFYKESAEPNPVACASDPFNKNSCTYATQDGKFFIKPEDQMQYNVLDFDPSS